ncbi:hypothetical protein GCM10009641_41240 [Mycobacterium cookii]|uniref:Uncharacterized protein n=1 Tax=Mycobacterium cookii TaxID=1775 RepID=A0A7I7KXP1_9MYCO|nr:hypothetical protein [Mycobacterium cookii]MCV7330683.1 hypothetical protein [Mycobacterium cookii]BBX46723.1 hypothetical protein MCOO_27380 [Mycobacterium cookii]
MSDSRKDAGAALEAVARVACVVAAIAALFISYLAAGDLYLAGFPDGHLTDYDKAVETPKRILLWVEFGFAPLFLVLVFLPIGTRIRAAGLLAALIVLGLAVQLQLVGLPWYFGSHLGLDNGIGG